MLRRAEAHEDVRGLEFAVQVVGVDRCRGGWVAVVWDTDAGSWAASRHDGFASIVRSFPGATPIGIDIPIGLRDDGAARTCDKLARRILGRTRGSSVFPAPQRQLLRCDSYADALHQSRVGFGAGISRQAFGIYASVREVDEVMTATLQQRVVEVHPEVSFWAMAGGQAILASKKTPEGFAARRRLLVRQLTLDIPESPESLRQSIRGVGADDVLDALAVAWTARRAAAGDAIRLPDQPEWDDRGLRMEIVY